MRFKPNQQITYKQNSSKYALIRKKKINLRGCSEIFKKKKTSIKNIESYENKNN